MRKLFLHDRTAVMRNTLAVIVDNNMAYDWTMFFDDFASDFHPTFQKELSRQLFVKGSTGTGIKHFDKHNLQLIVGMKDLQMRQVADKVFAKIDFITPTSFSFPVDIYWSTSAGADISEIHKQDISNITVDINWGENFPIDKILPHLVDTDRFD